MAKASTKPAPPAPYEPERTYQVRLTRIVRVGALRLLPRNEHQLAGAALNALVAEHGLEIVDAAVPRE